MPISNFDPFADSGLMDRYLADAVSSDERVQIERWARQAVDRRTLLEAMRAGLQTLPRRVPNRATEATFQAIVASAGKNDARRFRPFAERWSVWGRYRAVWAIAVILVLVGGGASYHAFPIRTRISSPATTYATRAGQLASVRLADGTRITLAPRTSIVVDAGFGHTNRDIHLTGQARFEVKASGEHPFIVRAGGVASRVLGTEFVIRHYVGDRDVLIAVQSGKVSAGRRAPVVITANSVARVTDSTAMLSAAPVRDYVEWSHGRITFYDTPILEVVAVISQWYGLTFHFADSTLARQHVTGAFRESDPRDEVLQSLKILLNARMTFQGDAVTLRPNHAVAAPHSRVGEDSDLMTTHTGVGR